MIVKKCNGCNFSKMKRKKKQAHLLQIQISPNYQVWVQNLFYYYLCRFRFRNRCANAHTHIQRAIRTFGLYIFCFCENVGLQRSTFSFTKYWILCKRRKNRRSFSIFLFNDRLNTQWMHIQYVLLPSRKYTRRHVWRSVLFPFQ